MTMETREVVQRCRSALASYYGDRFRGLVLYGSAGRGELDPESDIDLLVLLARPLDYLVELRRVVDLLYPVQLDCERLISAKPAPNDAFERGDSQLYRIAKREGLTL